MSLICVENGEIKNFYVDTFFESQGNGGKLLEFAVNQLGAAYLWVLEKNEWARLFYEKHGFAAMGNGNTKKGLRNVFLKWSVLKFKNKSSLDSHIMSAHPGLG